VPVRITDILINQATWLYNYGIIGCINNGRLTNA